MSFFTPSPFSELSMRAPRMLRTSLGHCIEDADEDVPDPYGNTPSVRITADVPDVYSGLGRRTVDEDTEEQYVCNR